ncbi:MAG: chemotaxis protein CheB [Acidobacteria bacterium]|nr:MAG: chemotaxis protein CheB [Acidobacteriota bacterium]
MRIVVIGASAGGVEALKCIADQLSPDIQAAIFVVMHLSPDSSSFLPAILNRHSCVPAIQAEDGLPIEAGKIYIAPPDRHLLLECKEMRVVRGPKHNRHRPAIDLLFRTAARNHGPQVIGVILTGFLDDGSSGLLAIKNAGGIAVVQDPVDAEVASMPKSALQQVQPDFCVPSSEIGGLINQLVAQVEGKAMLAQQAGNGTPVKPSPKGTQTSFTCPDCHGAIWEVEENAEVRFECRVGHAYSPQGMQEANEEDVERSLWVALRALEESAALEQRLADLSAERKRESAHNFYLQKAQSRKQHASILRDFLVGSKRRQSEVEGEEGKQEMERVS